MSAPNAGYEIDEWEFRIGVLRHVCDAEIVAEKRYGQAGIGDGDQSELGKGRWTGDSHPRGMVTRRADDRQRTLNHSNQERDNEGEESNLWGHWTPMAFAFSSASATSGGI